MANHKQKTPGRYKSKERRQVDLEDLKLIVELFKQGKTCKEITSITNYSQRAVLETLRNFKKEGTITGLKTQFKKLLTADPKDI